MPTVGTQTRDVPTVASQRATEYDPDWHIIGQAISQRLERGPAMFQSLTLVAPPDIWNVMSTSTDKPRPKNS